MAQQRHRKPVTLTLEPTVRQAADQLLAQLPVKLSLSSLVNELLSEWVVNVGPFVAEAMTGDAADRIAAMHRITGQAVERMGQGMADATRAIEEQENRKE